MDSLHSVLKERLAVGDIQEGKEFVEEVLVGEESHTFAEAVVPLLMALSSYLALGDSLPNARVEASLIATTHFTLEMMVEDYSQFVISRFLKFIQLLHIRLDSKSQNC